MTDHSFQLQRDFDRFSDKDLSPEGGSCAWKIIELLQKRPMHLCIGRFNCVEQGTGVEPALTAWEAAVIPIYQPCILFAIYGDVKNILSFVSVNVHIFLKKTGTEFRFFIFPGNRETGLQ